MKLRIKRKSLSETATVPTQATPTSVGYDLYADIDRPVTIRPGECLRIYTGHAMEIPPGYFGGVYARSGIATGNGLIPTMCVGIIDPDFRGNICVPLRNLSSEDQVVTPQERIAQIIFQPYAEAMFETVQDLSETQRGTGGFGSTGK